MSLVSEGSSYLVPHFLQCFFVKSQGLIYFIGDKCKVPQETRMCLH